MMDLSEQEIREYFDANPNATLYEMSLMTGHGIAELKRILMP